MACKYCSSKNKELQRLFQKKRGISWKLLMAEINVLFMNFKMNKRYLCDVYKQRPRVKSPSVCFQKDRYSGYSFATDFDSQHKQRGVTIK